MRIWYTVMYIGKTLDISMLFGFCSFLPILKTQQNPNRSAVLRCWLLFSPSVLYKYFWSFWSLSKLLNTATRYMKLRQANWWPGGWSSHGHWWPQSGHRFRLFIGTSFRRGHHLHFYNPYLYLYHVQCVIINMRLQRTLSDTDSFISSVYQLSFARVKRLNRWTESKAVLIKMDAPGFDWPRGFCFLTSACSGVLLFFYELGGS